MKYAAILVIGFLVGAFTLSCLDKPCPPPEVVYDTITVDVTCYSCLDSIWVRKVKILDSLHKAALDEVTTYREESIYQIDTMRSNFLSWMDSIKGLQIHDNLIIHGDTVNLVEARFDTTTGIPYLVFE